MSDRLTGPFPFNVFEAGELGTSLPKISENLCYVPDPLYLANGKVVADFGIVNAARSCSRSHPYTLLFLDAKKDANRLRERSFLIYDKARDSFTHYDPYSFDDSMLQAKDTALRKVLHNFAGTEESLFASPVFIPLKVKHLMHEQQEALELQALEQQEALELQVFEQELQALEQEIRDGDEQQVLLLKARTVAQGQVDFLHEDALYPPSKGVELYHDYDHLSPRQLRDLINSTRYVGTLMQQPEARETLQYLTWKDHQIAKCLRVGWNTDDCDDKMAIHLDRLDMIFSQAPKLSADLTIYRGIKDILPDRDDSFVFTTPNEKFAKSFLGGQKSFFLKITIPKGTPVLSYGKLSTHDVDEVILPRGGRFTINAIENNEEQSYTLVNVTYVYNEQPKRIADYRFAHGGKRRSRRKISRSKSRSRTRRRKSRLRRRRTKEMSKRRSRARR